MTAAATRLLREAERAADRLRVVGPRMAARSGTEAATLLDAVRADLQRLADVGADARRHPRRPVPVLAPYALADQVLVLAHDVAAQDDPAVHQAAAAVLADLRGRI